jgi:extracellular elastinolytic metalloproteinase
MYLWTGFGTFEVVVDDTTFLASPADFGPTLDTAGRTAPLAVAVDNGGPASDGTPSTNPNDACSAIPSGLTGAIAIADRGTCSFVDKAKNVQAAGAVGLIVANNVPGLPVAMCCADAAVNIPGLMVGQDDGAALKQLATSRATMKLADNPPLQRDGDVDSDIVWHEYGHGLTWRMIGHMDGPLAGAIGEGMSDVLSIIANEDDVVGEYSFTDPLGIRSEPYDVYSRTYGDIVGEEVHFDGEVYGAIGWDLLQGYQGAGEDKSTLLADLVDGMNYTPARPTFEQMRDGVLAGLAASTNDDRACMVWDAFAENGVGVGALATVTGKRVAVKESFEVPSECATTP